MSFRVSRRNLIHGLGGAIGAAAGARILGPYGDAFAQTAEKPAVLVVFLAGGYNAIFASADSFPTQFGVTGQNSLALTNGLVVDSVWNALSPAARAKMSTVGVNHGISNHGGGQTAMFTHSAQNAATLLASQMGGNAAIKAANVGQARAPGPTGAVSGVSLQGITDMQATLNALGAAGENPLEPKREIAAAGLEAAEKMSAIELTKNGKSLETVKNGFPAAVQTLRKAPEVFNVQEFSQAYTLGTNLAVGDFKSKMAAAELMIRAGTNVVVARDDGGWDTHGDTQGQQARNLMRTRIVPPLATFANRMLASTERNVIIAVFGEFARSLPGSDHGSALSVTVLGKYVKQGTTGKMNAQVGLAAGTPAIPGLWGYLAALTKVSGAETPFGGNPHTTITG